MSNELEEAALNQKRSIYSVIGNLCINPQQLRSPDIDLNDRDFPQEFHKIIFSAINNLVYSSSETTTITEIDIDNYLAPYSSLYKKWEKNNGLEYVRHCIENTNTKTFRSSYDRLKKFSLLRMYIEKGIDISDLYDYKNIDLKVIQEGVKAIDKMSVQDIIEHYTLKMMQIRDEWQVGREGVSFRAGDDLGSLLDKLQEQPEFGYPFRNSFYNTVFRGMRGKKLMLRSAGTGGGKSRQSIMDICNASCDMIYEYNQGWVHNGVAEPTLFISTELEKEELQTTMLAFVTGIDEDVIKDGFYDRKTRERLEMGIEVLKRAPLYAEYIDDFSIADIEMLIEKHIIENGVKLIAFDYIQMTPKLSRTMQQAFGSNLREDQILVQFSGALKILANKYNVYITTSTQLNRSSKDKENRDTSSLRGGSATADKVDMGIISFKVRDQDRKELKHILEAGFFKTPNFSHWVYKNRGGRDNIIIWTHMNLGTLREEVLFVTDLDFILQDKIKQTIINFDDDLKVEPPELSPDDYASKADDRHPPEILDTLSESVAAYKEETTEEEFIF